MYVKKVYEYHVRNFGFVWLLKKHFTFKRNRNEITSTTVYRPEMLEMVSMPTTQWLMTIYVGWIDSPHFLLPLLDNFIIAQNDVADFDDNNQ